MSPLSEPITLTSILVPADDVVSRDLEGDTIVVPIGPRRGDVSADFFLLEGTAQAIWDLLDGRRTLGDVAAALSERFDAAPSDVESDVLRFAADLVDHGVIVARVRRPGGAW